MGKKPFFIWIIVFVSGLSFVVYGLFQSIIYPDGAFVLTWLNGDYHNGIFYFILTGFLWIVTIGWLPFVFYRWYLKKHDYKLSPNFTAHVKVISKAFITNHSNDSESGASSTNEQHFIGFEFPDGSRKNFAVSVDRYNTILESEEGLLTYKEHEDRLKLIDFERQI